MLFIFILLVFAQSQPTPSDNCLVWNNDNQVCNQCLQGFYLQYYFCVPCSPLCTCKNSYQYCDECRKFTIDRELNIQLSSYRDRDRCRFCNSSIPNCLTCESSNNCTACFNGLYPTSQGMCSNETCTPNCQVCRNEETCEVCKIGYAVGIGNLCYLQDCTDNCTLCTSRTECKNCIDTFYEVNGTCAPCMQDCLSCTNQTDCELCYPGFYFINGTCYNTSMSNCVLYNGTFDNPVCLACEPGFYMSGGSCNQCQGCLLCSQAFICFSECSSGNVQFNYACISFQFQKFLLWPLLFLVYFLFM